MRKIVMGGSRIDGDLLIAPDYAGSDADQHYKDEAYFQFNCPPSRGRYAERKPGRGTLKLIDAGGVRLIRHQLSEFADASPSRAYSQ
jgi:hypothetical protein